jgi:regulatory protein
MTRRARSGRGWDAAPPRAPRRRSSSAEDGPDSSDDVPPAVGSRRRSRSAPGAVAADDDLWAGEPFDARPSDGQPGLSDAPTEDRDTPRRVRKRDDRNAPDKSPRDQREWAREICLRQLSVRPRTRAELATVLAKRGIAADVIAEVLDRYDEVGIIDDASFARAWVESRHRGKGLARRVLGQELRRKGVEQEFIKEALNQLEPETEEVTARELVERKLRTTRGEPDAVFRRLVGMLARKGYPPGVAFRAVKDVLDEHAQDVDDQGFSVEGVGDWTEALEVEAVQAEWDRPDRV